MFILKTHYNTDHKEQFDPGVAYINSTEKLIDGGNEKKNIVAFSFDPCFLSPQKSEQQIKIFYTSQLIIFDESLIKTISDCHYQLQASFRQ
jgi:hypothetical protein